MSGFGNLIRVVYIPPKVHMLTCGGEAAVDNEVQDFEELWKLKIPPKVVVFAWRLFRDRLPTKSNLTRRNVALNDTYCPFCRRAKEDAAHLFLHCHKILQLLRRTL